MLSEEQVGRLKAMQEKYQTGAIEIFCVMDELISILSNEAYVYNPECGAIREYLLDPDNDASS